MTPQRWSTKTEKNKSLVVPQHLVGCLRFPLHATTRLMNAVLSLGTDLLQQLLPDANWPTVPLVRIKLGRSQKQKHKTKKCVVVVVVVANDP